MRYLNHIEIRIMIESKIVPVPFFARWLTTPLDVSCDGDVYLGRDLHAFDGKRLNRFTQATRIIMALAALLTFLGLRWRGMDISIAGWEGWVGVLIALLGIAALCAQSRQSPPLTAAMALAAECLIAPLLTIFTYVASCFGGADQTALIASLDQRLGFDWLAHYEILSSLPVADNLLQAAYASFYMQFFALPLVLLVCGYAAHARLLLNCFFIGVVIVMSVATLFPSVDPMLWNRVPPLNGEGHTGFSRIDHMLMLRDGSLTRLRMDEMTGIICFPSFHTVAACLFAGFSAPLGPARFSMIALNAAMIAATPRWGGHYLVDVLAGIVIGVGLIAAAQAYTRRRPGPGVIGSLP